MSKKAKPTPLPPTILLITLEADGNGSLLTRRGELAYLSQFSYSSLAEIVTAIQSGAAALAELETHPPVIESASSPILADVPKTQSESTADNADDDPAGEVEPIPTELPKTPPIAQTRLL